MLRKFIKRHEYKIVCGTILIGVLLSFVLGVTNGQIKKTHFSDYRTDAEIYNLMALSLIDTGSVYDSNGMYYGSLRAPGYPYFLSFAYLIYRSPISVWILQAALFALSVFLVWEIAKHFFRESSALLPPLLFSLSWFIDAFVIRLNSDFIGMFWVLLGVWSLLAYVSRERYRIASRFLSSHTLLALSAASFALAALTRPVMLYLVIFLFIYVAATSWRHAVLFVVLFLAFVGPPTALNYYLFGVPVLSDSGVVIAMRGRVLAVPEERLRAFMIASVFGDLVADQSLPGYKDNPEPYPQITAVAKERTVMRDTGVPFREMNSHFLKEGLDLFRKHPGKFLVTGIFNFIHMHNPPNQDGVLMTHFLVERETMSVTLRIVMNMMIRVFWFSLVTFVVWGIVVNIRDRNKLFLVVPLCVIIFYNVFMHAFFSHAEFRFILPAIPFYVVFFSAGVLDIAKHIATRLNPSLVSRFST